MKVAVIHGQAHKGNTWHLAQVFLAGLDCKSEDIQQFFINGIDQCVGCFQCITTDEQRCPHRAAIAPIIDAVQQADVIVITSPNYCMGMTGQLKTFFDHMGYRWMSHRPHSAMFDKIGVAISTTAGMGASGVTRDICKQLFWWGVGKCYRLPFTASAYSWDTVDEKNKQKVLHRAKRIAAKVNKKTGRVKPGLKSKFIFTMMRQMQKNAAYNPVDTDHWRQQGWIE